MLNIYLCEDNKVQLKYFSDIIKNYLLMEQMDELFHCAATNPYTLLNKVTQSKGTGLYFLDIDLQADINGIQLASRIREHDPRGYIVFLTTHSEQMPMTFAYKVEAMDFIIKDQPDAIPEKIIQCIQAALKSEAALKRQGSPSLTLKADNGLFQIKSEDIVLIESDKQPHKLAIRTVCGTKYISGSLKKFEALPDDRFYRCHNSAIVNIQHVVSFQTETRILKLDTGDTCKVSFRLAKNTREIFAGKCI